jgi:hypothetical protein
MPATGGMMMARKPARIISTLRTIDHVSDFLAAMKSGVVVVALIEKSFHLSLP